MTMILQYLHAPHTQQCANSINCLYQAKVHSLKAFIAKNNMIHWNSACSHKNHYRYFQQTNKCKLLHKWNYWGNWDPPNEHISHMLSSCICLQIESCWIESMRDMWSDKYSISQEICTRFCCALLCCGYAIVQNEFTWSIYPYSSGLLCWHWGNR